MPAHALLVAMVAVAIESGPSDPVVPTTIGARAEAPCLAIDAPAPPPDALASGGCDDGTVIDVLVAWTPAARANAGGTAAIAELAQDAVDQANAVYAASDVTPRLRIVGTTEIAYDEGPPSYVDILHDLTDDGDGAMDGIHALRNQLGADLVALLVDDGEYCGIAWRITSNTPAMAPYGFSVTTWWCAESYATFVHEVGHNQGCCHAPGDTSGCEDGGLFGTSHGHRFAGDSGTQWRTVMAYAPGTRILNLSNPAIEHDGAPTGIAGARDNAGTVNGTAWAVANYRCTVVPLPCPADVDGNGQVGLNDVIAVLSNWGPCDGCPADVDGDGQIGFTDVVAVLTAWGPCG